MFPLLNAVRQNSREQLGQRVNAVFTRMTREKWSEGDIAGALDEMVSYLVEHLREAHPGVFWKDIHLDDAVGAKDAFSMKKSANVMIGVIYERVHESVDKDGSPQIIGRMEKYICDNYQKDISLSYISNELNMNYFYVSAMFTKKAGMPFSEYLRKVRLDMASRMLLEGNDRIYEIAMNCGFADSQHFCKVFRKQFHTTPMQYRQKSQNFPKAP
jgi:YesN/AraC family two-component response regulator